MRRSDWVWIYIFCTFLLVIILVAVLNGWTEVGVNP